MASMLVVLIVMIVFIFSGKLKFRLENVYKSICWFKWLFWFCELSLLPLLFNVIFTGNCTFFTKRDVVVLANCQKDGLYSPIIMIVIMSVAFALVFMYIVVLIYIIQSAKISTAFHEESIRKKEAEAVLRLNLIWRVNKYFTFSSFKSGVTNMYHRIYFNLLAILLCLLEVLMVSAIRNQYILVTTSHNSEKDDRINCCCYSLHCVLLHSSTLPLKYGKCSTLLRYGRSHNASCPHSVHSQ
jgi:hypothetical protein